jgi:hypothetical protein
VQQNNNQNLLPTTTGFTISITINQGDALAEINEITNISNYRNIGYQILKISGFG